jgi:hypothetical protein
VSERAFLVLSALLFTASATITIRDWFVTILLMTVILGAWY